MPRQYKAYNVLIIAPSKSSMDFLTKAFQIVVKALNLHYKTASVEITHESGASLNVMETFEEEK